MNLSAVQLHFKPPLEALTAIYGDQRTSNNFPVGFINDSGFSITVEFIILENRSLGCLIQHFFEGPIQ